MIVIKNKQKIFRKNRDWKELKSFDFGFFGIVALCSSIVAIIPMSLIF